MAFKCSRCGCEQHYDGALGSSNAGKVTFFHDTDERAFLSLATKGAKCSTTMCKECGLLELTGDAAKLPRITSE